jgi:hypothetical protein
LASFLRITREHDRKTGRETHAETPPNRKAINTLQAPATKNGFVCANNISVAPATARAS